MNSVHITRAAGWLAIVGSAVHLVATPLFRLESWHEVIDAGVWNTIALDPPEVELARAEAFWITVGGFAVPLLLLGCLLVWSSREQVQVPVWLGWGLAGWGVIAATLLPASPAWLFALVGAMVVLGSRRTSAPAPATAVGPPH